MALIFAMADGIHVTTLFLKAEVALMKAIDVFIQVKTTAMRNKNLSPTLMITPSAILIERKKPDCLFMILLS